MKAVCWYGTHDVRSKAVPDPTIVDPTDERIQAGEIDPSFVITHRLTLEDAPRAYKTFHDKEDGCIKVVLRP